MDGALAGEPCITICAGSIPAAVLRDILSRIQKREGKLKRFIIDKVSVAAARLPGMRLGQIALAAALTFAMGCALLPQAAQADSAAIWGRQTASGKFQTKKVTLNSASTITAVRYDGGGDGFCIWSGVPSAKSILCWRKGSASLVGTVLPAGAGYFIIPGKRTPNSSAYAQVGVK